MYYFLSLLTGILVSVMIAFNGGLAEHYGVYSAAIIIHVTGLIFITAMVLLKKDRVFSILFEKHSVFLYTGGAIGVLTIVFHNLSFGRISVSAILALGLLGQSVTGLVIDQYGLLGMPKHLFTKGKLVGLFLIIGGIVSMINSLEIMAVALSFASGISIVVSRTINAKLADLSNIRTSTFYNYVVGLLGAVLVFLILGRHEASFLNFDALTFSSSWWIYLGGVMGVYVVLLSNATVMKISAFYLTLLIFVGMIFSGILVDAVISQQISFLNLIGGVFVALGMVVNLIIDGRDKVINR